MKTTDVETALLCAGLIAGVVLGSTVTHLIWAGIHGAHRRDDRDEAAAAAKYVETKTLDNIELSRNLEQGLARDATKTDTLVARAKSKLKTPWVMVEKCTPNAYEIQPGFSPSDWYDAYRLGRDSVLGAGEVRTGAGDNPADSAGDVSASAAP